MESAYMTQAPTRTEIDSATGAMVLNFGTDWCGHCKAAAPLVQQMLQGHGDVQHVKVEDGSGRELGRSFHVTLWPTLVFLRDGVEQARVVRPRSVDVIREALAKIA
ncbi:thioredoxin [Caenimonas koreensis DSM 17982]|uniref:Thioredoxin n=1 Tax=Caenimonas koreensis DSM 17982 TaxID=1121255 RepID=A0A844AQJ6_9BURK|nr:thioredoxin family protein [Caenimonas koreensis]MRD46274.1 thioredoxin [Caenimonas koreensis DSM 17982]